jgi:hypothetical protein
MRSGSPGKISAVFGEGSVRLQPWKVRRQSPVQPPKDVNYPLEQSTAHLVSPLGRASCKALLLVMRRAWNLFEFGATAEKALHRQLGFV